MTPSTPAPETATIMQPSSTLEVQIAVLTEKVTQVIGDHERRIQKLENRGNNWPTVLAALVGGASFIVLIAGKVPWL